jgi:hypothetical protein
MVTFQDLGDLGPARSEAASLYWQPIRRYSAWPLWAIVGLLAIVPRANRRWRALAILLPLGLVALAGWGLGSIAVALEASGDPAVLSFLSFLCVGWGLTCSFVLLAAPWLAGRSRAVTTWKILAAVFVAALLQGLWYVDDPMWMGAWLGCTMIAAVAAIVPCMFAGFHCRREFYPGRFGLFAFLWLFGLLACATLVVGGILAGLAAFDGARSTEFAGLLAAIVAAALGVGAFVFVTTFPFLWLAFANPFYRERLQMLFQTANDLLAPPPVTHAGDSPFAAVAS